MKKKIKNNERRRSVDMVDEILEITKDENVTKGVIQSALLTGCSYIEILRCMGFKVN